MVTVTTCVASQKLVFRTATAPHGVPLGRGLVQLVAAREEHPRRADGQPDGQPDLVLGHALHHEADQDRDSCDEEDRLVERGHGRPIEQDAPDSDSRRHEDEPADPDAQPISLILARRGVIQEITTVRKPRRKRVSAR